ncbi:MAG: hypothetical protein LOX97_05440 [Sphingomonas sp.]|nr:hypothetical protein [Sphingomonas sp.]
MEYGDAITSRNLEEAVALALEEWRLHPDLPLAKVAVDAVGQAYCACVTAGKGAAPGQFPDLQRMLAEQVSSQLRKILASVSGRRRALSKGEESQE